MHLVDSEDPLELFLHYVKIKDIVYLARMEGSANIWMTSKEKIGIEGDILVSGLRSDYHMSFPPNHSRKTTKKNMNKKVEKFDSRNYQPQNTLKTHWDRTIEWSKEDEILHRELKYDLRKPLTPILKKHYVPKDKIDQFFQRSAKEKFYYRQINCCCLYG